MDYEITLRFLLAVILGALIGAEREYRGKSAGFRTMMMISLGSCLFTIISILIGGTSTPDRIASNIVTGIGFLGAGVIFKNENIINGITTSATIWTVAAVGMAVGGGYYFVSIGASIIILIILAVLPYLERLIDKLNQSKIYIINCENIPNQIEVIEMIFKENHLKFKLTSQIIETETLSIHWQVQGALKNHVNFVKIISTNKHIIRIEY